LAAPSSTVAPDGVLSERIPPDGRQLFRTPVIFNGDTTAGLVDPRRALE